MRPVALAISAFVLGAFSASSVQASAQIPVDPDLAKQVASKYADGGIISLSFGLLLAFLLYDAYASRKSAKEDRAAFLVTTNKFNDTVLALKPTVDSVPAALATVNAALAAVVARLDKLEDKR